MYYSFSPIENKAVGFVVFSELDNRIERIEFPDIFHIPIIQYARVRVAAKEFSYTPFNGMIYNVRIHFGKGYVPTME